MIRLLDGPAAGQTLLLHRAPLLLRVTCWAGVWDALDQIEDAPKENERIYVYRRRGPATAVHIKMARQRGQVRSGSGWYQAAEYLEVNPAPGDEEVRSNPRWQSWAWKHAR